MIICNYKDNDNNNNKNDNKNINITKKNNNNKNNNSNNSNNNDNNDNNDNNNNNDKKFGQGLPPSPDVDEIQKKSNFLGALASLDLKLSVSEWVIYRFQLAHLRVFQSYFT